MQLARGKQAKWRLKLIEIQISIHHYYYYYYYYYKCGVILL